MMTWDSSQPVRYDGYGGSKLWCPGGVFEIDCPSLRIGASTIIKDLKKEVENLDRIKESTESTA